MPWPSLFSILISSVLLVNAFTSERSNIDLGGLILPLGAA